MNGKRESTVNSIYQCNKKRGQKPYTTRVIFMINYIRIVLYTIERSKGDNILSLGHETIFLFLQDSNPQLINASCSSKGTKKLKC